MADMEKTAPVATANTTLLNNTNLEIESHNVVVGFDGPNDPENPVIWSPLYKWCTVALLSTIEFTTNLAVLICAPTIPDILIQLKSSDPSRDSTIIITIWNLGAMLGTLCIGPLSEVHSRLPLYNIANILFILFSTGSALSQNIGMLIAFRFLNGMTIGSQTLNSSIVGDMFVVEQRGKAQSLAAVMPLFGPVCGPIIGGLLSGTVGWRWTFWLVVILVGVQETVLAMFFRETYEPLILRRRAQRLLHTDGSQAPRTRVGLADTARAIRRGLMRPLRMFSMPMFLVLCSCVALIYSLIFIVFTTITQVFEGSYGFSTKLSGLSFLGIGIGMGIATYICSKTLDWQTKRLKKRHNGEVKPEWRLPLMLLGGTSASVGFFIYGWTAQAHVHWIVPIIGTAFIGFSFSVTAIPVITYLVDGFGPYRASAIAALMIFRQAVTIVLPLAGPPLYENLGLGWGNSVLGFLALLTVPVPFLFLRYGERMRKSFDTKVYACTPLE